MWILFRAADFSKLNTHSLQCCKPAKLTFSNHTESSVTGFPETDNHFCINESCRATVVWLADVVKKPARRTYTWRSCVSSADNRRGHIKLSVMKLSASMRDQVDGSFIFNPSRPRSAFILSSSHFLLTCFV